MQETKLQSSGAHILTSELAKRKHAVLLREAPVPKRQRTTDGRESATCARQFAFTPNSPLSPGRTRSQVTAEEPAGPVEIIDLEDAPDSSNTAALESGNGTQIGLEVARPAVSSPPLLKIEVFPNPVEPLLDPGPSARTRNLAVQLVGVAASALNSIASRPPTHEKPDAPPVASTGLVADTQNTSTVENNSTTGISSSVPSVASQTSTVNTEHDTQPKEPQPHPAQLQSDSQQPQHSIPGTLGSPESEPDAFQLLHHVAAAADDQAQSADAAAMDSDQVQSAAAPAADAEQTLSASTPTLNAELAHSAAAATAGAGQAQSFDAAQSETSTTGPVTVEQLIQQGPYNVDAAQQQAVQANLANYKEKVKELQSQGRRKPDMIAFGLLWARLTPANMHGHIPGVGIGARYGGRGEVAIVGIHTQMMRGINLKKGLPAYAIVMSGGYRDDVDEGLVVNYTGEGGQKNGKQIKDQSWTAGNLGLQQSFQQRMPVRVVRGSTETINGRKELIYTYDGLYSVETATMEKGQEGFQVCKFQLKALAGHSKAGQKVTYGAVKGPRFRQLGLVSRTTGAANAAQAGGQEAGQARRGLSLQEKEQRRLTRLKARRHLVILDISQGKESVRIPVFNEVDEEEPPSHGQLQYLRYNELLPALDTVVATPEATELLTQADALMDFRNKCGVQRIGSCQYTPNELLWETQKYGVYECSQFAHSSMAGHNCKAARNRVVSCGIQLPLEIFKTNDGRGWGVRCSESIAIGTFICDYVGKLITDPQAEQSSNDEYLFDLDHFVQLANEPSDELDRTKLPPLPPPQHPDSDTDTPGHLVIDARTQGNVARFINHSCMGNLVIQPVFTNGCNVFLYRIALFASQDISAGTELTYDYGYAEGVVHNRNMVCKCGSEYCRRRLL